MIRTFPIDLPHLSAKSYAVAFTSETTWTIDHKRYKVTCTIIEPFVEDDQGAHSELKFELERKDTNYPRVQISSIKRTVERVWNRILRDAIAAAEKVAPPVATSE